jgi:protein-tyrosine phosphatase
MALFMAEQKIKVLMVCLGNICRSPTAEAVFTKKVQAANLNKHILVDSAGTGSWHIGEPPDRRSMQAAKTRDYDMSSQRARQVLPQDMEQFDYIYAMDKQNLDDLLAMSTPELQHKVSLFLHQGNSDYEEVPDPYYSGGDGFELVLDLIEEASDSLLGSLVSRHTLI